RRALRHSAHASSSVQRCPEIRPGRASRGEISVRLVNRKAELRTILAHVEAAMAGQGGAVLLAGEAGIGKSRLALEIARLARERGLPVLVGRCPEDEGAPSYWPWTEILRSWFEQHEDVRVRPELRHAAAHVAGIVPEVRDLVPDLPVPTSS